VQQSTNCDIFFGLLFHTFFLAIEWFQLFFPSLIKYALQSLNIKLLFALHQMWWFCNFVVLWRHEPFDTTLHLTAQTSFHILLQLCQDFPWSFRLNDTKQQGCLVTGWQLKYLTALCFFHAVAYIRTDSVSKSLWKSHRHITWTVEAEADEKRFYSHVLSLIRTSVFWLTSFVK